MADNHEQLVLDAMKAIDAVFHNPTASATQISIDLDVLARYLMSDIDAHKAAIILASRRNKSMITDETLTRGQA